MRREAEESRLINIPDMEDHQEEEDEDEDEVGEVSKLINMKENRMVRINISSEGNDSIQYDSKMEDEIVKA